MRIHALSMLWLFSISLLFLGSDAAWAHGGGHAPEPPPPEPPEAPPPPPPPPGPPLPDHNPTTPADPLPPITPKGPPSPTTPSGRGARSGRVRGRTGGGARLGSSWRIWWEYNREYLLGLRSRLRNSATLTGAGEPGRPDPMAGRRGEVRLALREIASDFRRDHRLRSATLIALGRLSEPQDAELFLTVLRNRKERDTVLEAAALGLGLMPRLEVATQRQQVRRDLNEVLDRAASRSQRVRGFLMISTGLRARSDRALAMSLARLGQGKLRSTGDAASLAYSMGIAMDATLLPELVRAARSGEMGGKKLNDIGRSHAAAALGLTREPLAAATLVTVLKSRRAGMETRRGAALALGRLLREVELSPEQIRPVRKTLLGILDRDRDKALVSYVAIALATGREPLGVEELMRIVSRSGQPIVRPYAALGLALAVERMDARTATRVRGALLEEFSKVKEIEFASALAISVGVAGIGETIEDLIARVGRKSLPAQVRGAAAQGLGLLGRSGPTVDKALLIALRDGPSELIEGAAIGLGLLGRRGIAAELADRLKTAQSGIVQGRLTMALGYLGQSTAVDPLLKILKDRSQRRVVRELAAVALGILGDQREDDVLFDLDAYFNYFATTVVTHELITIF